jgi:arginyl-tRNA synthetase
MLALQGNTAPYMLYAFARIQGIRRKALGLVEEQGFTALTAADLELASLEERILGVTLLRFEEVLLDVSRDLYPSRLCEYLYDLSQLFNKFYEKCPVLKAETPALVKSRTALCSITADTLKVGLGILGIETLEKL